MKARMLAVWLILSLIIQGCYASTKSIHNTKVKESATAGIDTATPVVSPTYIKIAYISPCSYTQPDNNGYASADTGTGSNYATNMLHHTPRVAGHKNV